MSEVPYPVLWIQGATATIAFLALLVAGYSLYLQRIDKRPRLEISGRYADIYSGTERIESTYAITVVNAGHVPVTVSQLYIGVKRDYKLGLPGGWRGDAPMPLKLADHGDAATWHINHETLKEALRKEGYRGDAHIRLIAQEKRGKEHTKNVVVRVSRPWWRRFF